MKNKMRQAVKNVLLGVDHDVHRIIDRVPGTFGIAVKVLQNGTTFFHNERMLYPSASTIKLYILIELFNQIRTSKHALNELIDIPTKGPEGVWGEASSGVLKELESVKRISLKDAATLMIIVSDNVAANLLLDLLGIDRIQDTIQALGLKDTKLMRKMMNLESSRKGLENVSTPYELMITMENVAKGNFLDKEGSAMVLDILARTQDRIGLRQLMPDEVRIEHKTGELFTVCNDIGIVRVPGNPFIISVMSKDVELVGGWDVIAELGKLFYDRLSSTK